MCRAQFTDPRVHFCFCRAKFTAQVATGFARRSLFSWFAALGSIVIFAHGADTRDLRAPFSPRRPRARETAAMATQYSDNIVKPEPQVLGVPTPFVFRKIGLSDLPHPLPLGWELFNAVPSPAILS